MVPKQEKLTKLNPHYLESLNLLLLVKVEQKKITKKKANLEEIFSIWKSYRIREKFLLSLKN